jgi:hypothetical protein
MPTRQPGFLRDRSNEPGQMALDHLAAVEEQRKIQALLDALMGGSNMTLGDISEAATLHSLGAALEPDLTPRRPRSPVIR